MAFDGIVMHSVIDELKEKLIDGRVDKVYQPEKDEIFIHIRAKGLNQSLLISASSNNPRLYLTDKTKKNPTEAPQFCMILRKHLIGSTILSIEQYKTDRIVFIDMLSKDELGINREKRLIVEIMGRHSNIILIDKESEKVIDSISRVSVDMSSVRQIYPGSLYVLPPLQDKLSPLELEETSFNSALKLAEDLPVFKFIYTNYLGLSPIFSKEICFRAQVDSNQSVDTLSDEDIVKLFNTFKSLMDSIKNNKYTPNIAYDKDKSILGFHIIKLSQFESASFRNFDFISTLLDNYYFEKDLSDRINQKSSSMRKIISNHLDRAKNKLKKQNRELEDAHDREKYKVYADLISANIYSIEKGAKNITVQNFYDPELKDLEIPLDEKIPAHLNAQKYYKKYSRLKNASNLLKEEIPNTENEIEYLENVLYSITHSSDTLDLEDIKDELISEGYIKKSKKSKKAKLEKTEAYNFLTSNGITVLVGRNNRQNDELTFKKSNRDDIWLHAQNIPGSHVILKTSLDKLKESDLIEAARLAAYYSSGKNSNSVSIDYTERKHVRKQKGAKPGLVFYEDFNTISVNPNDELIQQQK